jgi:hypothetical protein
MTSRFDLYAAAGPDADQFERQNRESIVGVDRHGWYVPMPDP